MVLQQIGAAAYKLQFLAHNKIHPVFHVSQLKRAKGTAFNPIPIPKQLSSSLELVADPEQLVGIRADPRDPSHIKCSSNGKAYHHLMPLGNRIQPLPIYF